ncbi:MAG: hypothetical protein AB2A00_12655 [Myxococcota bacterium]
MSTNTTREVVGLGNLAAALILAGCVEKPDGFAANNVARLTVMGVGAMTAAVNNDDNCGFASPEVIARARIEGKPGTRGSVTLLTRQCEIDLGQSRRPLMEDCTGTALWANGKVVISARRTIVGYLTGDPLQPVIPDGPDAATVEILEARGKGFESGTSRADASLELVSGTLSAVVQPHLARSGSTGLCAVPTPITTISSIRYSGAELRLAVAGVQMNVSVDSSDFSAQAGRWGKRVNEFEGTLTLFGRKHELPGEGDGRLDPTYSESSFLASYACTSDLETPVSHECVDPKTMIGTNVARLSVATFGSVLGLVQMDTSCGFSSPQVLDHQVIHGEIGREGGEVIDTITTPCTIEIPEARTLPSIDCAHPASPSVKGRVTVTGTRIFRGIPTGDPVEPAVPTARDPVEYRLEMSFDDFTLLPPGTDASFTVENGVMSASLKPRLAFNSELGLCAIPTPVMELSGLTFRDGLVQLSAQGVKLTASVTDSQVRAINGNKDGEENVLAGTIFLDGEPLDLSDDPTGLNPFYDPVDFNKYQECTDHLVIPASDEDCSVRKMLAQNGARMLVLGLGAVLKVTQDSEQCGLPQMDALPPPPDSLEGDPTGVDVGWQTQSCALQAADALVLQECTGRRVSASGHATSSVELNMRIPFPPLPPIGPTTRDGVEVRVDAQLGTWTVFIQTPDPDDDDPIVTFRGGTLSATVHPIMGEHSAYPMLYVIPTPITGITDFNVADVDVTLQAGPKTLRFTVSTAQLTSFAGTYGGQSNFVDGQVTVNGEAFSLGMLPLDPGYTQDGFNASYVECTENLREAVPWQ